MNTELQKYPKRNQIVVKSTKTNKIFWVCFKNGQLFMEVFNKAGKSVDVIYDISKFENNYTIIAFNAKTKTQKKELYHNKTVIYNNELKCIIKKGDNYYVNYYREEKGKPMTYKPFSKNENLTSLNDYLIEKYLDLVMKK